MMSEEDHIVIQRYIAHELSDEEARAFERRMELDSDLHQEVEAYHLALYAIRQEKKGELKQRFMTLEEVRKMNREMDRRSDSFLGASSSVSPRLRCCSC